MKFNDKILIFLTLITNAYRSEENQEFTQQMTLDDENLTEDFTAMLFALNMFFNKITGDSMDVIDFTHLLNKLAFQHLMDNHLTEGMNKRVDYKELYEHLLEDFTHALHYAGKNNNVCNFCEHDCGEDGICKGRENWIKCAPKWRGVVREKGVRGDG